MKNNIIEVKFSRVYQYNIKDLDGDNLRERKEDAKRKAWLDIEDDFCISGLEPTSDNFSAKITISKPYHEK